MRLRWACADLGMTWPQAWRAISPSALRPSTCAEYTRMNTGNLTRGSGRAE